MLQLQVPDALLAPAAPLALSENVPGADTFSQTEVFAVSGPRKVITGYTTFCPTQQERDGPSDRSNPSEYTGRLLQQQRRNGG